MAILTFTLSEDGVAAIHEALLCLNRFSDDVSLDARRDKVSRILFIVFDGPEG